MPPHRCYCAILEVLLCIAIAHLSSADPNLPFGDINIISVTDVHSFIGGHQREVDHNADYGDLLSFYQHVKEYCDDTHSDLFFFNVGDWIHGTGLAMDGNATMLVPLLNEMPWDGITLGNHEAYYSAVVELMRDKMVPRFGEAFITSNADYTGTMDVLGGARFRLIQGNNNTILTFGFVYDKFNPSQLVRIRKVQDVLNEDWFRVALRELEYDAIVVLAHMDNDDQLVEMILTKIREHVNGSMPVQFLTGHTHLRKTRQVGKDYFSRAFEAGGNLDTVGFVSIPTLETAASRRPGELKTLFRDEFLNASKEVLKEKAGVEILPTQDGIALSSKISQTRSDLGLDEIVGCPPQEYFLNRTIHEEDSLFKLWIDHVAPSQIFTGQGDCAMIISSDSFRYDVRIARKGEGLTVDDIVAIVPYMEPVMYVGELPEWVIRRMNTSLNTEALNHHRRLPDYLLAGRFEHGGDKNRPFKFYTHEFNLPEVMYDIDRLLNNHALKPRKTEMKDTLYWLTYAETAWQCSDHRQQKDVKPWFANIKELDEEASDGERTSETLDELDQVLDREANKVNNNADSSSYKYSGFQGYLPPSSIEHYSDKLPPGIAPSTPLKPKTPPPKPVQKKVNKLTAAQKAERMERRKKAKKRTFRAIGALFALGLLSIPLFGLYGVFFPDKHQRNAMSDEQFYDMTEMRALKKKRNQRPVDEIHLT